MAWQRTDDLDGSPAEQICIGWAGKGYTLDLSPEHISEIEKFLQKYLDVAREYCEMPTPPEFAGLASGQLLATSNGHNGGNGHNGKARPRRARGLDEGSGLLPPQAEIRNWAINNGFNVGPKGRLPDAVIEAYRNAAHSPTG